MSDLLDQDQADNGADLRELQNMAEGLEDKAAPQGEAEAEQPSVSPELQAYGMARMICEVAARGAQMRWACLSYGDEVKEQGAQVLTPVFLKYNVQNEFMAKYAEEFAAGAFFAGVIFTSYQKIKQDEAERAAAAKAKAEKEEGATVDA